MLNLIKAWLGYKATRGMFGRSRGYHRHGHVGARGFSVGGLLPMLGFAAWQNRHHIQHWLEQRRTQRVGGGQPGATGNDFSHQPPGASAF